MNNRVKELLKQAGLQPYYDAQEGQIETFVELIIKDAVDECRQEWYELNNAAKIDDEPPRSIGIRLGTKGGVLRCISRINKHFGVEE